MYRMAHNKQIMSLAGTQTRARLRHFCTRVCAPYLEVGMTPFVNPERVLS